jgi:Family of unknown function (DUF6338)
MKRRLRGTGTLHMPDLKAVENFQLVVFFVVPGLIALFVRSRFIAGRKPSITENLLVFIVLSLFYYSFTVFFIDRALAVRDPWIAQAFIWISLVLLGPALFGFILGIAAQREWFTRFANWFGLAIVHIIPAAWDWRFSSIPREGLFVMVTLTSGERVAGLFRANSFASSDMSERDLYIEEEYTVTDQGEWQARPERVGILISAKEIRYIEFWNPTNPEQAESNQ